MEEFVNLKQIADNIYDTLKIQVHGLRISNLESLIGWCLLKLNLLPFSGFCFQYGK